MISLCGRLSQREEIDLAIQIVVTLSCHFQNVRHSLAWGEAWGPGSCCRLHSRFFVVVSRHSFTFSKQPTEGRQPGQPTAHRPQTGPHQTPETPALPHW